VSSTTVHKNNQTAAAAATAQAISAFYFYYLHLKWMEECTTGFEAEKVFLLELTKSQSIGFSRDWFGERDKSIVTVAHI
jgi:hypothetical protein